MQRTTQKTNSSQSPWWNQPIIYWQANQVAIAFHSPLNRSTEGVESVIASLKLDILEQFLATHGFSLRSFTMKDIPRPEQPRPEIEELEEELDRLDIEAEALGRKSSASQSDLKELETRIESIKREIEKREDVLTENEPDSPEQALNSPVGKYSFVPPSGQGTLVVCFFHSTNPSLAPVSTRYGHGEEGSTTLDSTRAIVTLLNQNLNMLRQDGGIPIVAAMPNWMGGGTGGITVNCPAAPPMPVTGKNTAHKNWHFKLPGLSPTMQELNGKEVTVFVLDTIPTVRRIATAANGAGNRNILLQRIATAIKSKSIVIYHQRIPKRLTPDIQTGKDLNGRLYGFEMPDHGLFVAGIIHDLVPKATIECVRVLNDSGVGDVATLCDALYAIQERMIQKKLEQVVINLSLEISPPDTNLPSIWLGNDGCYPAQDLASVIQELGLLRLGLHMVIQSLTAQGAVIVAASGNESNTNNHPPQRFGPRYPAAFLEVISVGAVNKHGQATTYSDYPTMPSQHNGIATFGGAIPLPLNPGQPQEPLGAKTWADPYDSVVGIYSSLHYPMLMATDVPPKDYRVLPNDNYYWAYWSGTSFATPIISSLAARVLEALQKNLLTTKLSVEDVITTAPGQTLLTSNGFAFPNSTAYGVGVGLLHAEQAHS